MFATFFLPSWKSTFNQLVIWGSLGNSIIENEGKNVYYFVYPKKIKVDTIVVFYGSC